MPATILGRQIVVTKNTGSGNFQFIVQDAAGGEKLVFALLSADMATAAALGSGASSTFTYGQDGSNPTGPGRADYPNSYTEQTGS